MKVSIGMPKLQLLFQPGSTNNGRKRMNTRWLASLTKANLMTFRLPIPPKGLVHVLPWAWMTEKASYKLLIATMKLLTSFVSLISRNFLCLFGVEPSRSWCKSCFLQNQTASRQNDQFSVKPQRHPYFRCFFFWKLFCKFFQIFSVKSQHHHDPLQNYKKTPSPILACFHSSSLAPLKLQSFDTYVFTFFHPILKYPVFVLIFYVLLIGTEVQCSCKDSSLVLTPKSIIISSGSTNDDCISIATSKLQQVPYLSWKNGWNTAFFFFNPIDEGVNAKNFSLGTLYCFPYSNW